MIAQACVRLTPLHRLLTCSGAEPDNYVVVREIHDHVTKRSDVALPDMLRVEFQRDGKTVRLDLERNKRVNVNVPVTFAGSDKRELVPDLNVRWQHLLAISLLSLRFDVHPTVISKKDRQAYSLSTTHISRIFL